MENTSGFYKKIDDTWFFAPHIVEAPSYILLAQDKNQYNLPIDGWDWYDEEPIEYSIYKSQQK